MSDAQLTKATGAVITALASQVQILVDRGLVEPDDLKLTIAARAKKAKALTDAGMSQRQAAKALGVDKRTVARDLGHNAPQTGAKSPTLAEPTLFPPAPEDDAKAAEKRQRAERKQLRWAATLNLLRVVAVLDREPAHAGEVAALYDHAVEQEKGEDRLTKDRLRQCADFLTALIEAWEDET